MTPPTTKLVAMTEKHVEALDIAIQCDLALSEFGDGYQKPLREIGSVVSSLASGEAVVMERGLLENLLLESKIVRDASPLASQGRAFAASMHKIIGGWLTLETPKEPPHGNV